MSEKRFELHSDEDTINIIDLIEDEVFNFQFDVVSLSDAKILVLRLNRLAEENEKLNSEMKINLKEFSRLFKQNLAQKRKINDLQEENEQLKQKIQRWKRLYELKDAEVTARVDALNKVCEYYTSEVLFKSDVDPNKAVKEVINEILNTEVEM